MALILTFTVMPLMMWLSTAAFLLYVPVLPLTAVVLVLIALVAIFVFGIHLGIEYARRSEELGAGTGPGLDKVSPVRDPRPSGPP